MDVDLELHEPVANLLDGNVAFLGITDCTGFVLNSLMVAEPNNPIVKGSLPEIEAWYKSPEHHTLVGPVSLSAALSKARGSRGSAGERMFQEKVCADPACPADRAKIEWLRYAICDGGHLVGWSRMGNCKEIGCGGTGYSRKEAILKMSAKSAKSSHPACGSKASYFDTKTKAWINEKALAPWMRVKTNTGQFAALQ